MNNITYAVSVDVNNPIIPYNVYVASVLDSNVRYLEITLYQNGNVITLSNTATATASLVTDNVLVDDSVNCTISNNTITVPLEGLQRHGNLDVQVTVTEGTKVLAIPFPIQVRVTPNIADEAQIDENSMGSYAEVVQEIADARGSYTDLKERLDHTDTAVEGKQDELTAGENITISEEGVISATGEYVDENALFDAINTAFTGGGTLVPSIAIGNDNQSDDCILYYVDGDFVRHDIFNFSQYFITEPYNLYDPRAAYTVTDASQTGKVGYSVDSGTGSITVTRAQGDGQKYIRYADKTLKAGTYTLSGKVTLHSNAADGNRTMCCNIGYEKTRQQVNLTTERGGSQNIGSSDKEGWFSCTVTLSYDQVFSFEAIPWSASVCNSNLPAVLSNVQIIEGADIGAYSPAARTSVDIKARALIEKRGDELASDIAANTTALKNLEAIPYSVKLAMDTLFSKAAYADDDAASSYATFHAWAIANPVTSITAVFTQGSATIYGTDSLYTLKQYLVVTATYSDSTTATVTDYTLSGTLTEGTSTITVSYGGKTATFNVTVTEKSLTVQPNITYAYVSGKLAAAENRSATSIIPIDDTSITHTVSAAVNGVEVDIVLRVFDQNGLAFYSPELAKSQTIPAKDYKCFGVVLTHAVTANDVVTVTVDGVQEQASYGTLEEYSNTVPVDIQVGGINFMTGEIIENSARLVTGFIDIVPGLFNESAPAAQLLLTAQSGVYVKVFEYSDSSFLQNSSIGALDSNQAIGNPASDCTKFRVVFKKSDSSNFTSADIESLTLNNYDIVTYEFTEVN